MRGREPLESGNRPRGRSAVDVLRTCGVVATQGLGARPLRTALAVTSLVVGIVAVVCVWTASAVAERAVVARAELATGRAPTFAVDVPTTPGALETAVAAVGDVPGGAAVLVPTGGSLGVTAPRVGVSLVGVAGDLRGIRPFPVRSGVWLDGGFASSRAPHLVLNEVAADRVQAQAVPARLVVEGQREAVRPVVVGVVDDGSEEANAYLRFEEAVVLDPTLARAQGARVMVHGDAGQARAVVLSRLAATGAPLGQFTRVDQAESLRTSVAAVRTIFVFIAAVALVVGALAVLNIGLATIGERVDELALRRAVGTRGGVLATVVLVESLLVGLAAAGLGLAISAPLLRPVAVGLFADLPADVAIQFPWGAALAGAGCGCLASVAGGLVPALRAAGIPIATVMRA